MIRKITNDIVYVGVDDTSIDLFEGQYNVPNGMCYNSYVVLDYKVAVFDTVDANFTYQWLDNIDEATGGRSPDYLIVQHMEPDHSANIFKFSQTYPSATIVANSKTFAMIQQFFGVDFEDRRIVVEDGGTFSTGTHNFTFVFAPMVHWPEVMVTYDSHDKVLFSADGFGKFGRYDADEPWDDEARRYYIGIVGKYGAQVQSLLKKAESLDIEKICPLHGPVLSDNLHHYISLYKTWSSYTEESDGIVIAYSSVYGNTKNAVEALRLKLTDLGCPKVIVHDLSRCDLSLAISDAFRYNKLVLATTTYNSGLFPSMHRFIHGICERNFQKRTVGLIENGSWAPLANKIMKKSLSECKNIDFLSNNVTIKSALNGQSSQQLDDMAAELCRDYIAMSSDRANKNDLSALFKIGYGLYVITCSDGKHDNGLIVNTVSQVTDSPGRIAVTINKQNYSHHIIKQSGVMNINCLSVDAPFSVFECFGFRSGRNVDKFEEVDKLRSDNGMPFLSRYINSFISLKVINYLDIETHGMFICEITEARVLSDKPSMSYAYYHENVKPKPPTEGVKGWVCDICGFIHEDEDLPDDFICPLCKHGVADFSKIGE